METAIRVRPATRADERDWDTFLDRHAGGWPLAVFRWSQVLEDCFRAEPLFLIAQDANGEIFGVLPAYATNQGGGTNLYALSRSLIARTPEAANGLVDDIQSIR